MKIPYVEKPPGHWFSRIFPHAKAVYKPLITVVLRHGEKKQKLYALVDSGADTCLFPKGVADKLGIDVKAGEKMDFTGLGGDRSSFFFHEVEILFGSYQIQTKVGFSSSPQIGVGGILGQQGFFDQFVISFDYSNKYIEIRKPSLLQSLASKISLNIL